MEKIIEHLVGDTPVSEQISVAVSRLANEGHTHDEYALRADLDLLKRDVEMLKNLLGGTSVSEQIAAALQTFLK